MPTRYELPQDDERTALREGVVRALHAVPMHFVSTINVEGISTTDFDKIPLEIILGIGVAIFAIIMLMTFGVTTPSDISLEVSLSRIISLSLK